MKVLSTKKKTMFIIMIIIMMPSPVSQASCPTVTTAQAATKAIQIGMSMYVKVDAKIVFNSQVEAQLQRTEFIVKTGRTFGIQNCFLSHIQSIGGRSVCEEIGKYNKC